MALVTGRQNPIPRGTKSTGTECETPSRMEPAAGFEPATYRLRGEYGGGPMRGQKASIAVIALCFRFP